MCRDVGKLGQSYIQQLCNSAGMVCNPAIEDKKGWDFFLEIPNLATESGFVDLVESTIECKIQVKSTETQSNSVSLKLSTLKDLICTHLPVFVCLVKYEKGSLQPSALYIKHVGREVISDVLFKIHQSATKINNSTGKKIPLNKQTKTIRFTEQEKLSLDRADSHLKDLITHYVGKKGIKEYFKWKSEVLESSGYDISEGHCKVFSFITKSEDDVRHLVDASIGLIPAATVYNPRLHDTRFGIKTEVKGVFNEIFRDKSVSISMPDLPPTSKGKILIYAQRLGRRYEFEIEVYNSFINSIVEPQYRKIRIVNDFFEIIFNPYELNDSRDFTYSIKHDQKYCISKLENIFGFLNNLKHTNTFFCEFHFPGIDRSPEMAFTLEGVNHDFELEASLSKKLFEIISHYNHRGDLQITPVQLIESRSTINKLHSLIGDKDIKIHPPVGTVFEATEKPIVLHRAYVGVVADKVFGKSFFVTARIKKQGKKNMAVIEDVEQQKFSMLHKDYTRCLPEIKKDINARLDAWEKKGAIIQERY